MLSVGDMYTVTFTHQSESPKHGEAWKGSEDELCEGKKDDNAVKDVPALLEVARRWQSDDLQDRLDRKDSSEKLQQTFTQWAWQSKASG